MIEFRKIKTSDILIAQLAVSAVAIGFLSWVCTSTIKTLYYYYHPIIVSPWALTYFHPQEAALFNYLSLCLVLGIWGLALYNRRVMAHIRERGEKLSFFIRVSVFFISIVLLAVAPFLLLLYKSIALFLIAVTPLIYLIPLPSHRITNWICVGFTGAVFFVLCWQVIQIVTGPVFLMSEYPQLFSRTILNDTAIDNGKFLKAINDDDAKVMRNFLGILKRSIQEKKIVLTALPIDENDMESILRSFQFENFNFWKKAILSQIELDTSKKIWQPTTPISEKPMMASRIDRQVFVEHLRRLDMEIVKKFQLANCLEYTHQNMSRGQINHIGHILNPLNEYDLGKPLQQIYCQYGWGNTLLMKGVMSLFGGMSLHNYYKCYIFYILYYLFFLMVMYVIFRDYISIAGTFAFFSIAFFYQGYTAFVLAPGIISSIRLFDVLVLLPLLFFSQSPRTIPLLSIFVIVIISLVINSRFGLMITGAVYLSILFYIYENSKRRIWHASLLTVSVLVVVTVVVFGIIPRGPTGIIDYYLMGYFSWRPNAMIVAFTIIYLAVSYLFLIRLREQRFPFKYLYAYVFFYTQGLFIYFYWSGLLNHFPIVIPWMGIQLFLMFHITNLIHENNTVWWFRVVKMARYGIIFLAMLLVLVCVVKFYIGKIGFQRNFKQHQTYHWQFARADLISTINPAPLQAAISLLNKYGSSSSGGVFILSRYDQLLPFLSGKYSAMPYFDLPYYLVGTREENETVDLIRKQHPRYIFVDSGINNSLNFASFDPWAPLFNSRTAVEERQSRFGRMQGLERVFTAISSDYIKVDEGQLISVYKRRSYSE